MIDDPHTHGLWEKTATPLSLGDVLRGSIVADVTVIGAGFTGLSTALHLNDAGSSVVVLEAIDVGFGGSGRNVGLVNAGMWVRPDVVTATLGEALGERLIQVLSDAPRLVFELIKTHDIECEVMQAGTLHCGVGRKGLRELEVRAAQWMARGAPVRLLDDVETAKRTGTDAFSGALLDSRAGTLQPLAYTRGLARAAKSHGVRIFTQSPALAVAKQHSGWVVRTPAGSVRSEWIVVATDAYASGPWKIVRAEQILLPYFSFATAPLGEDLRGSILPGGEGAWDTRKVLSSFRLDAAGRLIFGSVGTLRGATARVHEAWARRALRKTFPQLGEIDLDVSWFGHIGMTDDNLPRFHAFAPNVIGFNGYNGRGIAPGTVFGRVLADLIIGKLRYDELPLPVTEPRTPTLKYIKEKVYDLGSAAVHFASARF